ncbi:MAG: DUF58 domain-containing protein [Pseudomonadota bacterium]
MQSMRRWIDRWLFRLGAPEPGEILLTQRRVFILPSKAGLGFAVLLVVMFIGSINYNLSLGFGLTFLIAACAVIDMHLTFRNLAYLHLAPGRVLPVFAGEDAQFDLHVTDRRRYDRFAIWIGFIDSRHTLPLQAIDVGAAATTQVTLGLPTVERGWQAAPRIRLSTQFPLGLLRAWSYWHPEISVLVYPRPEDNAPSLPVAGSVKTEGSGAAGTDDFAGIRVYQPGDSPRQLAWRHIARTDVDAGAALVSKHFEGGSASDLMLDFEQISRSLDVEIRLSRMTRWILEAESRALVYGFRLGGTMLEPGIGPTHQQACLRALALYEGY